MERAVANKTEWFLPVIPSSIQIMVLANLPVIDGNNSEHYCIFVDRSSMVTVNGFKRYQLR